MWKFCEKELKKGWKRILSLTWTFFDSREFGNIIKTTRSCSSSHLLHFLFYKRGIGWGFVWSFMLCMKIDSMSDLGIVWELFWIRKNTRKIATDSDCNLYYSFIFLIYMKLFFLLVCAHGWLNHSLRGLWCHLQMNPNLLNWNYLY